MSYSAFWLGCEVAERARLTLGGLSYFEMTNPKQPRRAHHNTNVLRYRHPPRCPVCEKLMRKCDCMKRLELEDLERDYNIRFPNEKRDKLPG